MQKIIRQVDDSFQKLKYLGEQFGIDDLVDAMKGKAPPPQTLQEYITLREIELADQVGIEITKSTF